VQASSSLQEVPSVFGCATQASWLSSQTASLHWSAMPEQSRGVPRQTPSWQVSPTVQKAPSSQGPVIAVCWQTPWASQASAVQALLSSVQVLPATASWQVAEQQSPSRVLPS